LNKTKIFFISFEVTGDNEIQNLDEISDYHLILTTPEKWDSLTRKWRDCKEIVQSIKLFLIDEVHLLNEGKRGSTLEAIVSRMKLIIKHKEEQKQMRFICVSATIPN
jgi:ATP-dependent DNA helicase HFM1/MER3